MKIAVATNGDKLESMIPETFEESACLLIVETDDNSFEVFRNPEGSGMAMAQEAIKRDCEAVISGSIEKPAFEELSMEQVTRYLGAGCSAKDALDLMDAYQLEIIRVPNGEVWEPHDHSEGECDCGHSEDDE